MAQQDEEGTGHYSLLGELHRIVYVAQARTSDSAHTEYLLILFNPNTKYDGDFASRFFVGTLGLAFTASDTLGLADF